MPTSSYPLFVYLQRPDTGDWVTVGRYAESLFRYADSYLDAGCRWSIDPVNLPLQAGAKLPAPRYGGLHDALRDAGPDAWGKMLLQHEHGLTDLTHESRYLQLAGNTDRWGALAFGASKKPSVAHIATPKLPQLDALSHELLAVAQRQPARDAKLRKRLLGTSSLGGARPKATVQDGDDFWLVKPSLMGDPCDVPLLEHACGVWAKAVGINAAETVHEVVSDALSVVRIKRFDRSGKRRTMAVSAASLLQAEYPTLDTQQTARWSYPRLAEELKRIGAPLADRRELFDRMVFNAVIGNDDDHPRNHAVLWSQAEQCWRLSPSFDVVPSALDEAPKRLSMQLSLGRRDISREAALMDAHRFGFASQAQAGEYLDALLGRIQHGFLACAGLLSTELRRLLAQRLQRNAFQ